MVKKRTERKKKNIKRVLAEINKKSGISIIGKAKDMDFLNIERIPTGILGLDTALGGGFPKNRIIELYGLESGGKTLISLLTIKSVQEQGGKAVFIDAERSFDPVWAEKIGVNIEDLYVAQIQEGEDIFDLLCELILSDPDLIVVDSVAAMVTNPEMEESIDKAHMAVKARLMGKGVPKLNALNSKTSIIFINQLRSTLVMYGAPTTTTGGRTLHHFASIRIEVKKGDFLRVDGKKTTDVIGQVINYYIVKNKTAQPFKKGSFKLFYDVPRIEE